MSDELVRTEATPLNERRAVVLANFLKEMGHHRLASHVRVGAETYEHIKKLEKRIDELLLENMKLKIDLNYQLNKNNSRGNNDRARANNNSP